MDQDEQVFKVLMSMIGSNKKLQYRTPDGQILKISLGSGNSGIAEEVLSENNCNSNNTQAMSRETFSQQLTALTISPSKGKKVTLKMKNRKVEANQAVLNFMNHSQQSIKEKTQQPKFRSVKTVQQTLSFLSENHPEDKDHLELIRQRMSHLEKVQQQKMKLDEEISSILSSSFSRSFDPSQQISMMSMLGNVNSDPLCQIFNSYIRKTSIAHKSNQQKAPSFLFLYSQPMIDEKSNQINGQINYFEEEATIQKILKSCCINYIRQRATINKFHYWVKQNVSILHFCGHGVKQQTNYLLFESFNGLSVKMDANLLSKILGEMTSPLKLVFVASCHSESTGRIFKEAGAKHVICVKDNHAILDQICTEFVKFFYLSVINDKMSICSAFQFAKKQVVLTGKFTVHQCEKFILLKSHAAQDCTTLDILTGSDFIDITPKAEYSRILPSRVENFITRPRDLHQVLKMVEGKRRFITIVGYAGIGKSTLVRELVRYIQFRDFFRDGVIYIDIRSCENIQKVFQSLNFQLFDNSQIKLNKTFQQNAQRVNKQLTNKNVLIVLDNCQSIMSSNDRQDFKKLIESIMKNCLEVYFIFTHRYSIERQIDYCSQKIYQLEKLNQSQSERLFFQRVPRNIEKKQLDQFFAKQNIKIGSHPFFQFLNGHPQAICMTASLLSERRLSDIYDLLMKPCINISDQFGKLEEGDKANKLIETAMKISLNVLKNKHKEAAEMIKVLSLIPRGLDPEMMSKLFGAKWKQTVKKLVHHSLVQYIDNGGPSKYYTVHPYIIIYVENQISNEEKSKLHDRICEQFYKRIERIYKFIGTISVNSQKAQQQFLNEEINYQAIIYRELAMCGDTLRIKRLYGNLFQRDFEQEEQKKMLIDIKSHAVQMNRKKLVFTQRVLQPTKKQAIIFIVVYYVTILFVMKNHPACIKFIEYGVMISRKKSKLIIEANLMRVLACISFIKCHNAEARQYFHKSLDLFALEGCGLGSASCEAAIGYIKFMEEEYAIAKKHMESALKYYDQIPHPFGKHYLNRWLCSLKSRINREQTQLHNHRQQAQKLLKQAKISLKSHNINNTELIKHKVGIFVFRFTFDNISLFLQASFEVDTKPKIINYESTIKKTQQPQNMFHSSTGKILDDIKTQPEQPIIGNNSKENYKKAARK